MDRPPSAKAGKRGPAGQRGSGWFEFGIAAVLLALLAAVLVRQLLEYQAIAEEAVVSLTVRNMRSGLRWQVAEHLMRGRAGDLGRLDGANPVAWLVRPPDGYAGEFSVASLAPQGGGTWFFDLGRSELAYVPLHAWRSGELAGTTKERRWHVTALKSSGGSAVSAAVAGLVLAEVASAQ